MGVALRCPKCETWCTTDAQGRYVCQSPHCRSVWPVSAPKPPRPWIHGFRDLGWPAQAALVVAALWVLYLVLK
jgi:hypothetical protein